MKPLNFIFKATAPILAIFLLFIGINQLRAQSWGLGGISIGLAMIGLFLSKRSLEKNPFAPEEIELYRPYMVPTFLWIVIIGLLALSVFFVVNSGSPDNDRAASLAWLGSVLLGLLVAWGKRWGFPSISAILGKIKAHRVELCGLFVVLALAFVLRTLDLSTHPYPWSGDEASVGMEADKILRGSVTNLFGGGWSSEPNWSFVPTAIAEMIFGKNIMAIRLTSAIAGTLAVLFTYLAAREFYNPLVALLAAAFLAALPNNLHFSRIGVHNINDSLFSALVFLLIARAARTNEPRDYYLAGAAAGLCIYTYVGTRLVLIMAGILLIFLILRQRGYLVSHRSHLFAFALACLISITPLTIFFMRHTDIFISRFGQEGILFNGWLAHQSAATGMSIAELLLNQFIQTILVFIASPAAGNYYNSPYPYLTVFESVLFLLGMGYVLVNLRELRNFTLLIWFWFPVLIGGVLTLNPPANTRLLMTTPVISLLMALGMYQIIEYLQRFKIIGEHVVRLIFILVACIVVFQNYYFYMVEYKTKMLFQEANAEFAMEIGLVAHQEGNGFQIFVIGAPRVFVKFPTLLLLAPDNLRKNVYPADIETLKIDPAQGAGFFAIPDNRYLLDEVIQKYPGGRKGTVYRKPRPNEILFEFYILSPSSQLMGAGG